MIGAGGVSGQGTGRIDRELQAAQVKLIAELLRIKKIVQSLGAGEAEDVRVLTENLDNLNLQVQRIDGSQET
jgi:hypothetical protein